MAQLDFVYWVSTCLGFIYIVGSALMGHIHGGHGDDGGDGGDPGDVGDGDGSGAGGDDPGDIDVSSSSNHNDALRGAGGAQNFQGSSHASSKPEQFYFSILSLLSPTKVALFLFFAGAIGVLTIHSFPWLGNFSLIPAAVLGYFLARIVLNALNYFVSKMDSSTNFKKESLIGTTGQLVLSIEAGKTGEISVANKGGRHNAPARAAKEDQEIKNLSKVIVVDCRDGIFYVEPVEDDAY